MPWMRELGYALEASWHRHVLCRLGLHSWDGWFRQLIGRGGEELCCICDARRALNG